MRIPYDEMKATAKQIFMNLGIPEDKAEKCAEIHTQSSAEGIESHGMNRIPRFVEYVQRGWVDINAEIELVGKKGAVENYDGHQGIGVLNASFCMDRAIELAKEHGVGVVALRNTTHWMRGGSYAWQAARAGFVGISWVNTESCMPMWGSKEQGVGNNPFCMAIPRENGPIVLDMAMSQYAYGKLGVYRLAGKKMPTPCGFDDDGNMTNDPGTVEKNHRIMPTGFWKGSSMAFVLDLAAAVMANGNTGADMDKANNGSCTNCCQIFMAYDPYMFGDKATIQAKMDERVALADATEPDHEGGTVMCPGEDVIKILKVNMEQGVQVDDQIWAQLLSLASGNMETKDIAST